MTQQQIYDLVYQIFTLWDAKDGEELLVELAPEFKDKKSLVPFLYDLDKNMAERLVNTHPRFAEVRQSYIPGTRPSPILMAMCHLVMSTMDETEVLAMRIMRMLDGWFQI